MPLPTINKPTFETTLPSNGTKIEFRPFLVGEEKILLTAKESGDRIDLIRAIRQVVQNCVLTDPFNSETITTFDLEWLFIQLRAKSVNNIVEIRLQDEDDGEEYTLEVDLDKVEIINEVKTNKVELVEEQPLGMIIHFPTPKISEELKDIQSLHEVTYQLIISCIQEVYDEDNVYPWNENTQKEKEKWIDSLSVESYDKLREFFLNMPRLFLEVSYTNSEEKEKKLTFQTLDDFFSWD